jgi:hypothetical protein
VAGRHRPKKIEVFGADSTRYSCGPYEGEGQKLLRRHRQQDQRLGNYAASLVDFRLLHLLALPPCQASFSGFVGSILTSICRLPFPGYPFPDISDSVVNFTRGALRLRSLNLDGFVFDHERLCQSLEQHTRLQSLTVTYPDMKSDRKPEKVYLESPL